MAHAARAFRVQFDPTRQKVLRIDMPEHHVGVGHGGLLAPTRIAGWAGVGFGSAVHLQDTVITWAAGAATGTDRPVGDQRYLDAVTRSMTGSYS